MYTLQLPALPGLTRLGLMQLGPHSWLRLFVEHPVEAAAVDAALEELKGLGYLDADGTTLDASLDRSLAIIADPVFRLQVLHKRGDNPPRAIVFDSDGIAFATGVTDGRELVVSPVQTFEEVATGALDALFDNETTRGASRVDLLGLEVSFLGMIAPSAVAGELTAAALCETVTAMGGKLSTDDASKALDELCDDDWLARDGDTYRATESALPKLEALMPDILVQLTATHFAEDREIASTTRFVRRGTHLWRIEPFLAGHDSPPPEGASELVELGTLIGLSYVPQSRDMVRDFLSELLGIELKSDKPQPKGGPRGVGLGRKRPH